MNADILWACRIVSLVIYGLFCAFYSYMSYAAIYTYSKSNGKGLTAWQEMLADKLINWPGWITYTFVPVFLFFCLLVFLQYKTDKMMWIYCAQAILVSIVLLFSLLTHMNGYYPIVLSSVHLVMIAVFTYWNIHWNN